MARLELERGGDKIEPCSHCGGTAHLAWGYVRADGDATAVYYLGWTEGAEHPPVAHMTVGLGRWGDGTDATMRRSYHVEVRPSGRLFRRRKPGLGLVDEPFIDE